MRNRGNRGKGYRNIQMSNKGPKPYVEARVRSWGHIRDTERINRTWRQCNVIAKKYKELRLTVFLLGQLDECQCHSPRLKTHKEKQVKKSVLS